MNLARLARAGFAVPPGFIISTDAYREFVSANRWLPAILSGVADLSAEDASALERASAQIRVAFSAGKMPEELETAIRAAYAELEDKPVAVRSSATAEDLPDLSFAGSAGYIFERDRHRASCWRRSSTAGQAYGRRVRSGIASAMGSIIMKQRWQSSCRRWCRAKPRACSSRQIH